MTRRAPEPPTASLDDAALIRGSMALHAIDGEIPRGIKARLAAFLGVTRATVSRAGAGKRIQLSAEARKLLEAHVADPVTHPLPPGSELRGRPRADAPALDPERKHSRGGGRIGGPAKAGSAYPPLYLLPAEEEMVREIAAERALVPGKIVAEALKSYARSPDPSPPAPPEGAKRCMWKAGVGPVAALDRAIGGPRGRREHVRAAVLRAIGKSTDLQKKVARGY